MPRVVMKIKNMPDVDLDIPDSMPPKCMLFYQLAVTAGISNFEKLMSDGCSKRDACGVLPAIVAEAIIDVYRER